MKLFVANIDRQVTEAELSLVFSECGAVTSVKIITDRATGAPKGFGFVEMATDAEAQKAIELLEGKLLQGRKLTVAQAKPKSNSF